MSDDNDDLDFEDDDDTSGADLPKKLRAQIKKLTRQNAELQAAADKAAKQARTSSLSTILKGKGVPVGLARLYEGEDTSDEAVTAWLHEVKDDFGLTLDDDADTDEDDENMFRLQQVANQAPKSKPRSVEDMIAHLQNASIDDLKKDGLFEGL